MTMAAEEMPPVAERDVRLGLYLAEAQHKEHSVRA